MSALTTSALTLVTLTAIPAAMFAWNCRPLSIDFEQVDRWSIPKSDGINDRQPIKIQERLAAESDHLNIPLQSQRFYKLLNIHRSMESHFITAPGFGVERTSSMHFQGTLFELPDQKCLPQPSRDQDLPPAGDVTETVMAIFDGQTSQRETQTWHLENLAPVVSFPTREYVEWEECAKYPFQTHIVSLRPRPFDAQVEAREGSEIRHRIWRFDDASLVSLLKHRSGAVYISYHLLTMNDLFMNFPTRPLDEFETDAIRDLRSKGNELFVVANTNHLRMVGPIRATFQCLGCHQVPVGTLLGAFSYRFSRLTFTTTGEGDSADSIPNRELN